MQKNLTIIIPAHNEQARIGKTLQEYCAFFSPKKDILNTSCIVVLNGCTDNTAQVVNSIAQQHPNIHMVSIEQAGKGIALATGFAAALQQPADLIGFVDADMATQPRYFYELIEKMPSADGAIASRYMPGAQVTPKRPFIKTWGRKIVYDSLVRLLFGMHYYDTQCGAKVFSRAFIAAITPELQITHWSCDVELLYLAKRHGFTTKEIPTTWHDQAGSKLKLRSGIRMLGSLFSLRLRFSPFHRPTA